MKKGLAVVLTILILSILNWVLTLFLPVSFADSSIPFAVLALFITHSLTGSESGMLGLEDMETQSETGIKMDHTKKASRTSYVFIGSIIYLVIVLLYVAYVYREYLI
ncbi:hypothetical protein [Planococcus lenghuensis]|uniref:Uncharacterized protein n=1 Tax=Planococcus lenghuensis TaxID=2213202 RepID=A0A1Q2KYB0_9BACL|nr:hypothetical protein [Planococcus lenghuensis]AQQ53116.1 hypothetical protein B0X71_08415 [Planococcus lenghuensis]